MTEDFIRKIKGLLATAESLAEQGNDEAATSYIAKAHQLQQKYSIDQAMLAAAGKKAERVVVVKVIKLPGPWGRRKVTLAHQVSNQLDCMGYFGKQDDGYTWTAFGFPEDVEWLETLVTSLCHQADEALRHTERPADVHHKAFGAAFMAGFTHVVAARLQAARRAAQQEASQEFTQSGVPSVALVLADKKVKVEAEYKATFRGGRKSYTRSVGSSRGYSAGRSAGDRASLARGSIGTQKGLGR